MKVKNHRSHSEPLRPHDDAYVNQVYDGYVDDLMNCIDLFRPASDRPAWPRKIWRTQYL